MKAAIVVVVLLAARSASGGAMNLTWGAGCWPDNPSASKTFACNTNSGSRSFAVSFQTSVDVPQFTGLEVEILVQADAASLPAWWQFVNAGSCRANSLTWSTTTGENFCLNPWNGSGVLGSLRYLTTGTSPAVPTGIPNQALIDLVVDQASPSALLAGTEYDGLALTIDNAATVGAGSCAGCATGVVLDLVGVGVRTPAGVLEWECNAANNSCITWQQMLCPTDVSYGFLCGPVPAHRSTWGGIKTLWR